jgi:predicted membrane protein
MVNGVMSIVAAVLFAVIGLQNGKNMIWLTIAAVYLVWGILNLIAYVIKNYRKQRSAQQALKKAQEQAAQQETPKPVEIVKELPVVETAEVVEV